MAKMNPLTNLGRSIDRGGGDVLAEMNERGPQIHRFNVRINDDTLALLADLQERSESKSAAETFRKALAVYDLVLSLEADEVIEILESDDGLRLIHHV